MLSRKCDEHAAFSQKYETRDETLPIVGNHAAFSLHTHHRFSTHLARQILMNSHLVLARLIDLERRVRQVYRILSDHPQCSPALRSLWQALAEDEPHDIITLERSAYVCDVMEHPPETPDDVLARVETVVASTEAAVQNPSLTEDEALRQALLLEASELNRLEDAWLRGFRITTSLLLRALAPEVSSHISRLVDAVHSSSTDPTLHAQADALGVAYHKQRETASRPQTAD